LCNPLSVLPWQEEEMEAQVPQVPAVQMDERFTSLFWVLDWWVLFRLQCCEMLQTIGLLQIARQAGS